MIMLVPLLIYFTFLCVFYFISGAWEKGGAWRSRSFASSAKEMQVIYVTIQKGRCYPTFGLVVPPLIGEDNREYDAVYGLMNSWNQMANLPNGEYWEQDLRVVLACFEREWQRRNTLYYYTALMNSARDASSKLHQFPAELLWQIAANTTDCLWERIVELPGALNVCIVDTMFWPESSQLCSDVTVKRVLQLIVLSVRLLLREIPCGEEPGDPTDENDASHLVYWPASTRNYKCMTWWEQQCAKVAEQLRWVYVD